MIGNFSRAFAAVVICLTLGAFTGCANGSSKSLDLSDRIRRDLDRSGLRDVTVSQERDRGIVTLGGRAPSDADKSRAAAIAQSDAPGKIVEQEIAAPPAAAEFNARTVYANVDEGISQNLEAALIETKLSSGVSHDVKDGVVTLEGQVNSAAKRRRIEKIAWGLANVRQVVNEIQVKTPNAGLRE